MKYRVHKIEHNYNQIWHGIKANKYIVVNYNFTIYLFGYSVTKPLKQTLDLNMSLGTVAKPNLEAVKHLHVYTCKLETLAHKQNFH